MNQPNNRNLVQILIHFIAWGVVFGLPFMISSKFPDVDIWEKMMHQTVIVLSFLAVFYINFFILTERFLFHKKIGKFILYNLLLIVAIGLIVHFWSEANTPVNFKLPEKPDAMMNRSTSFLIRDIISLLLMSILSTTIKITGKWYDIDSLRKEEEKKRSEAELINLRQQLHPHFLFNTLNNIYALIAISPDKAQDSILELSKLLRYVLYENNQKFVPLERELDFINNYIELMRIRLLTDVDLRIEINVGNHDQDMVAPMLFMTLIENAFKHGICQSKQSFIHIGVRIDTNNMLVFSVRNSYLPKDESDKSGSGIGLENLRRRLNILYPGKHHLDISLTNDCYTSELCIPLTNA